MPLCCATLHITVRSCTQEAPVIGADVWVEKVADVVEGDPLGEPDATTDDTGTVTILVGDEGTYKITAMYNGGYAYETVEAACEVNNVDILFGQTERICFEMAIGNESITPFDMIVWSGEVEVGRCAIGGVGRCCVDIPGPGTYPITSSESEAIFDADTIVVEDDDCGDKVVRVTVPAPVPTCEKLFCITRCGCPPIGMLVTVDIPGGGTFSGTTGADGCASIIMPEGPNCDGWIGADYTIEETGQTGTISADPMNVNANDPPAGNWCWPGDPCVSARPASLTATLGTGWGAQSGTVINLPEVTGEPGHYRSICSLIMGNPPSFLGGLMIEVEIPPEGCGDGGEAQVTVYRNLDGNDCSVGTQYSGTVVHGAGGDSIRCPVNFSIETTGGTVTATE